MEHRRLSPPANGEHNILCQTGLIREQLGSVLKLVDQLAGAQAPAPVPASSSPPIGERTVRKILALRRSRSHFFDQELFADPAWDMLLELYAAELAQQRVTVSSLCHGAAVPTTTALRWITLLEKKGLIIRRRDPMDGRRIFVSLSDSGLRAMENYFRTVSNGSPII